MRLCPVFSPTLPYKEDIEGLEHVQGKAVELVKDLENESYEEQLREMEVFSREKRRDLATLYNSLKGDCSEMGAVSAPK